MSHGEPAAIVCAPLGQDAEILVRMASLEKIPCRVVATMADVGSQAFAEALLLLLSEEALNHSGVATLKQALTRREPWSDLPIILLSSGGATESPLTSRFLNDVSAGANISIVERPARVGTLRSVLRVAANARRRQFQVRELIRQEKSTNQELHDALTSLGKSQAAQRLLADIVNSSEDAIVSKDLNGIVTSWNRGAERLFGYSRDEAVGQPISLIIPQERLSEEINILQHIRSGEGVDHFETVRLHKNGSLVDISLTISPIQNAEGKIVGASKVARNISQRKQSEEALRQSEQRFRDLATKLELEVQARTAELRKRTEEVEKQSEQLRALSIRLMTTQDEERRYIARELHDSAGQTITVLGMNLSLLGKKIKDRAPELQKEIEESQETLSQLSREIRTASYLLHPPLLDEAGLKAAIDGYATGLVARGALSIDVQISDEIGRVAPELELIVFRVVQESVTNIIRHSGSKTAVIRIYPDNSHLKVEIRDFGHGMPSERLNAIQSQGSGVGVRGMRERVQHFGGEMTIASDASGTAIHLSLPV
jgi:PAS domain S-box-containing protein